MEAYINFNNKKMTGALMIETGNFFPCSEADLKWIKKLIDASKDKEQNRRFVKALNEGVNMLLTEAHQRRVELCAMYQCREISQKRAVRELKELESRDNRLEKNRKVIEQWQKELQTSSN